MFAALLAGPSDGPTGWLKKKFKSQKIQKCPYLLVVKWSRLCKINFDCERLNPVTLECPNQFELNFYWTPCLYLFLSLVLEEQLIYEVEIRSYLFHMVSL